MKNEEDQTGTESDLRTLAKAQRIRMDKERSAKPSNDDIRILAEAKRIRDDEDRSNAVRKFSQEKNKKDATKDKPKDRPADIFAGFGSIAGKLKARRELMEAGNPEDAGQVFIKK